jgi:D-sedoheptulose 7-phosphate isomerase
MALTLEDFNKNIVSEIESSIEVKKCLLSKESIETIASISREIINAYQNGKKIIWFGNGGSAADAQHLSCELVSTFEIRSLGKHRPPIRSVALTTNTSILTAIGNDFGFDHVFRRQIEALADEGDIVIGISTSGTSKNVVAALRKAKEMGAVTIGFTGDGGGTVKKYAKILLEVKSKRTRMIQEAHMTAGHTICYLVEQFLFGGGK